MITTNELRQKYLDFFKEKGHVIVSSSSLIPENDPTTLFTGSGMQPMVPYLLGEVHPEGTRITDSQKCFRTQDIDEIGDNRHTTYFEMLGNWSFGDYFKMEQIDWIFEFLTKEIKLDPNNLYITCFRGNEKIDIPKDEEAAKKWQEKFKEVNIDAKIVDFPEENGMQGGKIFYYDDTKNWWSRAGVPDNMPIGEPGGPDAELFYDFGEDLKMHEKSEFKDKPCHVNCDCGRFVEMGNNVFMEYMKTEEGYKPLKNKNIDFGGGLERLVAVANNNPDIFLTDSFDSIRENIERLSGKKYGEDENDTKAFRVIMDHLRATAFLIGDNAVPSNKDQGYFTRRVMRRAIRFAEKLGIEENFCPTIIKGVINYYKEYYPDLKEKEDVILTEVKKEEEQFRKTLEQGLKEFKKLLKGFEIAFEKTNKKITEISGKQAFKLYDTYGFPIEMTEELAEEHNLTIDKPAFEEAFKKHQELSRKGAEQKFKGGLADNSEISTKYHTATHLLHSALRKVLGDHVGQKGSNITEKRLRFDFSHPEKMTDEEKKQVEELVNNAIQKNYKINFEEMSVEDAKSQGAIGLFEDRYDAKVKVYTVGEGDDVFSKEICGGPHVENTGDLGHFRIKKEQSSSSRVRRIKAILE
jgi:alanyl-tRNA synthetase